MPHAVQRAGRRLRLGGALTPLTLEEAQPLFHRVDRALGVGVVDVLALDCLRPSTSAPVSARGQRQFRWLGATHGPEPWHACDGAARQQVYVR
eukprot:2682551-Rhodomonas_salina.2